jgi:Ca2+-transporting ATPase
MTMRAGQPLSAWSKSVDSVLETLLVNAGRGLDDGEADRRRARFGRNELRVAKKRHVISILKDQFTGIVTVLLLAAGALALVMSNIAEAVAIFAVIVINSAIGFFTEWRAIRSMEALRKIARVACVVLRDGMVRQVAARDLVPGDVVVLDAGDIVPADLRLIEAHKLNTDESTLTGESLPVAKQTEAVAVETTIFDRNNMAYKGTAVTRGSGQGVVVATGPHTEFGKIFEQVSEAHPHRTHLEKRLDALGTLLAWVVIVLGAALAIVGVLAGRDMLLAVEVAIALAVAAIPEGLPIVATIALARGMWRMAQRNALVTRLSAVETLGATSVILADKTGTLTENRMTVTAALLPDIDVTLPGDAEGPAAELLEAMLTTATLCNGATLQEGSDPDQVGVGDPTERALLEAANVRGIRRDTLLQNMPEVHEDPFDPDQKRMATVHRINGEFEVAVKGAPEVVVALCNAVQTRGGVVPLGADDAAAWLDRTAQLCTSGLRAIAVARKPAPAPDQDLYAGLVLQGVFGLEDPPRANIGGVIDTCRRAGIAVIMATGDHADTARNIAARIGVIDAADDERQLLGGEAVGRLFEEARDEELLEARVFSRVTPEQKLRLIELHQHEGHVVAMTGDGVNDAPALKKADIGVAMGLRGTAVAREAAEMVLQDDDLGTIVVAIEHGRAIFENIRKFALYLLSCNTSEILVVTLATVAGAPLPLLPLQILFLNLVTDVFPALALGVGPGRPGLMREPPRPAQERILPRRCWVEIGLYGTVLAVVTLAAMAVALLVLGYDTETSVTIAFSTLALAQLWHVFNMRGDTWRLIDNEITRNPWIWMALVLCLALILMAVYLPVLNDVLRLTDPGINGWLLIVGASVVPLIVAPLVRRPAG